MLGREVGYVTEGIRHGGEFPVHTGSPLARVRTAALSDRVAAVLTEAQERVRRAAEITADTMLRVASGYDRMADSRERLAEMPNDGHAHREMAQRARRIAAAERLAGDRPRHVWGPPPPVAASSAEPTGPCPLPGSVLVDLASPEGRDARHPSSRTPLPSNRRVHQTRRAGRSWPAMEPGRQQSRGRYLARSLTVQQLADVRRWGEAIASRTTRPRRPDLARAGAERGGVMIRRWVKVFVLVALVIALALLAHVLIGSGSHGPALTVPRPWSTTT